MTLLARWVGAVDGTVDDHEGFSVPVTKNHQLFNPFVNPLTKLSTVSGLVLGLTIHAANINIKPRIP